MTDPLELIQLAQSNAAKQVDRLASGLSELTNSGDAAKYVSVTEPLGRCVELLQASQSRLGELLKPNRPPIKE